MQHMSTFLLNALKELMKHYKHTSLQSEVLIVCHPETEIATLFLYCDVFLNEMA